MGRWAVWVIVQNLAMWRSTIRCSLFQSRTCLSTICTIFIRSVDNNLYNRTVYRWKASKRYTNQLFIYISLRICQFMVEKLHFSLFLKQVELWERIIDVWWMFGWMSIMSISTFDDHITEILIQVLWTKWCYVWIVFRFI